MSPTAPSLNLLRSTSPLAATPTALAHLSGYLLPTSSGGAGRQAHQMTINGLTYPFVRHYNFAAVPDVPHRRRYDMYSGLHLIQPGDLLFFFQSDPQDAAGSINSRRGLRGVYCASSSQHRGLDDVTDQVTATGFRVLARCPTCQTFHGEFKDKCWRCNTDYPAITVGGESRSLKVLSSRISIEPVWAFERSVSDERTYADFADPGLVWTGRHDNAMGLGKGSSIRHLLPEEAIKLTRLLINEPGQAVGQPAASPAYQTAPLLHSNGLPIEMLEVTENGTMTGEDQLYFLITRQIRHSTSHLRQSLSPHIPSAWDDLEYLASTFPWGYTGGAADYLLVFRNQNGRSCVLVIECKKGNCHDEAVLQVQLYVERVLQTLFLSNPLLGNASIANPIVVQPIVIARGARKPKIPHPVVAIPQTYTLQRSLWGGSQYRAEVRSPVFLSYTAVGPLTQAGDSFYKDVGDFKFIPLPTTRWRSINWQPPPGAVGTNIETAHILRTSWAAARASAGI